MFRNTRRRLRPRGRALSSIFIVGDDPNRTRAKVSHTFVCSSCVIALVAGWPDTAGGFCGVYFVVFVLYYIVGKDSTHGISLVSADRALLFYCFLLLGVIRTARGRGYRTPTACVSCVIDFFAWWPDTAGASCGWYFVVSFTASYCWE